MSSTIHFKEKNKGLTWIAAISLLFMSNAFESKAQQAEQNSTVDADEPVAEVTLTEDEMAYRAWAQEVWESMQPQQGEIQLAGNVAKLNVPDGFYFLDGDDSRTVLVDIWGNPDSASNGVLGMLFPAQSNPFDSESWGVTIEYEQDGYVEDSDAADIDYDEMLTAMKADTKEASKQRVEMGYEPIELIGWAAAPYYDSDAKKLHWAKEIHFGDSDTNTLNYNIRVLGRQGVLVLNFIAGMDQLEEINHNLTAVLDIPEFKEGARYSDFDPEIDEVAAYGVGALVAGKVLAKTGFLAAALMFLKKFGVFILIALGALIKRIWSARKAKA